MARWVYGTFINGRTHSGQSAGVSGVAANGVYRRATTLGTGTSYVRIVGLTQVSKDWAAMPSTTV